MALVQWCGSVDRGTRVCGVLIALTALPLSLAITQFTHLWLCSPRTQLMEPRNYWASALAIHLSSAIAVAHPCHPTLHASHSPHTSHTPRAHTSSLQ